MELRNGDRRIELDGQLRDRLTDIPVVVDDFVDGEPQPEQVASVQCGSLRDVWAGRCSGWAR
jgi:hypothetical protein